MAIQRNFKFQTEIVEDESLKVKKETAQAAKAEEKVVEQVVEKQENIKPEIYSETLHGVPVRCMGEFGILKGRVCGITMSNVPTDRNGNKLPGGPSARAYSVAKAAAGWLAEKEATVVVAGFRDIDMGAINEALKHGGFVAVFVPYGINKVYNEKFGQFINDNKLLIVSTSQDDNQDWRDGNPKLRNELMVKSCDCLLIPHIDTTYHRQTMSWSGGVYNTICAAAKENVPVFFPKWREGEPIEQLAMLRSFPNICQELESKSDLDEVLGAMFG